MSTVFSIAYNDLRRLYTNVMAGIVMVGLIAIPCLFAWFNVLATWDPFGNTERLEVAVANTDRGHTSDLTPLSVNVGDMVLSQLYRDDSMDWVITDADNAIEGAKSGEYYAAIVLPPTLSDDMFTFYAGNAEPSRIDLYVNEKKNPISPVLISSGAQGVSAQISASFTRVLAEVSFGLIETTSDFFNEAETKQALDSIETRTASARDQLLSSASTVDALASLTESSVPLVDSAERISGALGDSLGQVRPVDLGATGAGLGGGGAALAAALGATSESFAAISDRVDQLMADSSATSQATAASLTDIAARIDVQVKQYTALRDTINGQVAPVLPPDAQPAVRAVVGDLNDAIARQTAVRDRLNDAAARLTAGQGGRDGKNADRQEIKDSIARAREAMDSAKNSYDTGIRPRLEALSGSLDNVRANVDKARSDMDGVSSALANRPGSLRDTLAASGANLRDTAESLRASAARMQEAQRSIAQSRSSGDLTKLADLVSSHPEELADALVDPVKVGAQGGLPPRQLRRRHGPALHGPRPVGRRPVDVSGRAHGRPLHRTERGRSRPRHRGPEVLRPLPDVRDHRPGPIHAPHGGAHRLRGHRARAPLPPLHGGVGLEPGLPPDLLHAGALPEQRRQGRGRAHPGAPGLGGGRRLPAAAAAGLDAGDQPLAARDLLDPRYARRGLRHLRLGLLARPRHPRPLRTALPPPRPLAAPPAAPRDQPHGRGGRPDQGDDVLAAPTGRWCRARGR